PLRGTVRAANGDALVDQVMLRAARLGSDGGVMFRRSTVAFTERDGTWKFNGLPAGRYLLGVNVLTSPSDDPTFPATWYPNARTRQGATVLNVSDDRTLNIDFPLPRRTR